MISKQNHKAHFCETKSRKIDASSSSSNKQDGELPAAQAASHSKAQNWQNAKSKKEKRNKSKQRKREAKRARKEKAAASEAGRYDDDAITMDSRNSQMHHSSFFAYSCHH